MAGGNMYILHRHMNVEIGTEAALFPEKEYIMGIFFAVCGLPEAPFGADSCGAGRSPGPWTDARTEVQTVMPQLGTVFPGMPARFLHTQAGQRWRPSLGAPCRGLATLFIQFVILLWLSFIYEEITKWNINKSANRLYIYASKVE
jgi:hypothetical protein